MGAAAGEDHEAGRQDGSARLKQVTLGKLDFAETRCGGAHDRDDGVPVQCGGCGSGEEISG